MTDTQATYTPDPTCLVNCQDHLCRRRDGQLLDGTNGDCHAGARLALRLEATADRMIFAAAQHRTSADQAAREADADLRCYLDGVLGFIRPLTAQHRLRGLVNRADHLAIVADVDPWGAA